MAVPPGLTYIAGAWTGATALLQYLSLSGDSTSLHFHIATFTDIYPGQPVPRLGSFHYDWLHPELQPFPVSK